MSELNFSLLEHLPEGVICVEEDHITAVNVRSRALLPGLKVGQHIRETPIPAAAPNSTGIFSGQEQSYRFSTSGTAHQQLFFYSPISDGEPVSTGHIVTYLRQSVSPLMLELAPKLGPEGGGALSGTTAKSLYSLVRLINNMDFLDRSPLPTGTVPVDLVSLCRRLTLEAGGLLQHLHLTLRFECALPALILPGDPVLLERLLLELIANSAGVTPAGGEILLQLTHPGRRALLSIRDGGSQADGARLMAAMSGQLSPGLPRPGQGAGLGLAVARRIVRLHRGALMVSGGPEGHCLALSLPVDPSHPSVSMHTPFVQTDGGLSPLLLGLCDLLPGQLFDQVSIT